MQIFEFPGNELIRIALRFEHLHNKTRHYSEQNHPYDSQIAVLTIAELIGLIDRVDLRNMLTREISRHLANLRRLQTTPQVDHAKLGEVVGDLEKVIEKLHRGKGLFAKEIFDNYFIQNIRRQNGPPGADCPYNMPELQCWLDQNAALRHQQMQLWLSYFADLHHIIDFLLQLARESMLPRKRVAEHGIYQETITNSGLCQLIRVWLPNSFKISPKFNLSQHKVNIRFQNGNINNKCEQINHRIEFDLAICSF